MPAEANEAPAWSQLETTLTAFLGRSYDFFFSRFFFGGYRADAADVSHNSVSRATSVRGVTIARDFREPSMAKATRTTTEKSNPSPVLENSIRSSAALANFRL